MWAYSIMEKEAAYFAANLIYFNLDVCINKNIVLRPIYVCNAYDNHQLFLKVRSGILYS